MSLASVSPAHQEAVRRFQRRTALFCLLRTALIAATLWTFLWGTILLAMRALSGSLPFTPWWGAAAVLPILGAAFWAARRSRPDAEAVRALMDRRGACGGLLTASAEQDIGVWRQSLRSIEVPPLRWDWKRPSAAFCLAAAFLAGALTIPLPSSAYPAELPLQIDRQVEDLTQKIELLEEEQILETEQAQSMRRQLAELQEQAEGDDPVHAWEALDHLENRIQQAAREAAEEAVGSTEKLAKAEMLAKGMADGTSQLSPDLMSEASQELSSLLGSTRGLPKDLEGLPSTQLNGEQLKRLADRLHRRKKELHSQIEKLSQLEMAKYETLEELESAGQCNSKGLADYLARNAKKATVSEMLGMWSAGPGRGAVTRGRGDAPLTSRDDFVEEGYDFKELVLPPSSLDALSDSIPLGLSRAAPEALQGPGGSQGGSLSGASSGGGSAATRVIEPRHRGAVKRYFERGKQ